jgi:hypothetical protein
VSRQTDILRLTGAAILVFRASTSLQAAPAAIVVRQHDTMSREPSIDETYSWLRDALEHLVSIPRLSDDDFDYIVFEVLDVDVCSCLHESTLDRLVMADRISALMKAELLEIRSSFLSLVRA